MKNESYVNVSPRRNTSTIWFACRNLKVASDGSVDIENITEHPVEVLRHEHFADICSFTKVLREDLLNGAFVSKIYDLMRTYLILFLINILLEIEMIFD